MSLLNRKRILLAKIETTYGVDPTPTGGVNAILVKNLDMTPLDAEMVQRDNIRTFLGNYEQLVATTKVMVTFEVELAGAGAAGTAPGYGPLLRACGLAETITPSTKAQYDPVSASFESVTIWSQLPDAANASSPLHKFTGCRGNVEFSLNARQIPVAKFSFTGLYNGPADAAVMAGTYTSFKTPVVVNKANTPTFSFLGYTAIAESFSLNMNNEIVYRNLINDERVLLVDRKAAGSLTIEAPTLAAKNFFTEAISGSLGNLSIVHGSTAGYIVEFAATGTVDVGAPKYGDKDGIAMMDLPYVLVPTTAGNDEFSLIIR